MTERYENITSGGKVVGQILVSDAAPTAARLASDSAIAELADLDRSTGMSRLMRESLAALLGVSAPAALKSAETKAAAARAKVIS